MASDPSGKTSRQKTYLWRWRPLMWLEDELHAMCKQGLHGVLACGVIVTILLLIPVWVIEFTLLHRWPKELVLFQILWEAVRG